MFAFMSLESPMHWLMLLLICITLLAIPAAAIIVVVIAIRRSAGPSGRNLVPCPDCGNKVSRLAKTCPRCGRPLVVEPAS
jgi:predicted amidophosphoribosyltransferase